MRFKEWMVLNEGLLEIPAKVDRQLRKFWILFIQRFIDHATLLKHKRYANLEPKDKPEMQFKAFFIPDFSGTKYEYLNNLPDVTRGVYIDGAATDTGDFLGIYHWNPSTIDLIVPANADPLVLQNYLSTLRHEFVHHMQYLLKKYVDKKTGKQVDAGGVNRGATAELMKKNYVDFSGYPSSVATIVADRFPHVDKLDLEHLVHSLFGYILLWEQYKEFEKEKNGKDVGDFKNIDSILDHGLKSFYDNHFKLNQNRARFTEGDYEIRYKGNYFPVSLNDYEINRLAFRLKNIKERIGKGKFRRGNFDDLIHLMVDIASKVQDKAYFPKQSLERISHQLRPTEYQTNFLSDLDNLITQYLNKIWDMLNEQKKINFDKDFKDKAGVAKVLRLFVDKVKKLDNEALEPDDGDKKSFKKRFFDGFIRYRYNRKLLASESPEIYKWSLNNLYDKFMNEKTKIKHILNFMLSQTASFYDHYPPQKNPIKKLWQAFRGSKLNPKFGMKLT